MARIAGVELQDKWRVDFALTKVKGVGWSVSNAILKELKLDSSKRVSALTSSEIASIATELGKYPTEGELARQVKASIGRLKATGSYRGVRHTRGLPVRGQRTRTNARTKRGKRKTVGAFKKEALSKVQQ